MRPATAPTTVRLLLGLIVAALLLGACGGGPEAVAAPATDAATTNDAATVDTTTVARADAAVDVFAAPGDDEPTRTLPATTGFGSATTLLVTAEGAGDADGWLEVLLPVRPNGTTGWIRAADVELRDVALAVEIDLDARRLTVRDGGAQVLSVRTAVGAADTPTPTGRFYVTDTLQTPDPDGAYGPYALGLSARSEALTGFGGGDGQIGIHGTDVPDSVGRAASHGCLRVRNRVIRRLARILPLGTPVTII